MVNREAERKRLVELLKAMNTAPEITCPRFNKQECKGCEFEKGNDCDIAGREADYLLNNGIGIKPPIELCKRKGDYIFVIDDGEITEGLLCLVHYNSEGEDEIVVSDEWDNKLLFYKFADYGKTVFTSREDAEKALKGDGDSGKS